LTTTAQRVPRLASVPDAAPSDAGRRQLYAQAVHASERPQDPEGFVALVLLEVQSASVTAPHDERVLVAVTTRLSELLNRRLRSVDLLVRSASCELAVLLTLANMGVAAAFSERLRHPIEQVLRELGLADEILVCMGIAANPPGGHWHPVALIELADFRMREAMRRARDTREHDWALFVDGAALPGTDAGPSVWPATFEITNNAGL